MILIGIGANLTTPSHGTPLAACREAITRLAAAGVIVTARSGWYASAPVPASAQPWFVNGVAAVAGPRSPAALLDLLHRVEAEMGRRRGERWAARVIDLDLLAWHDAVTAEQDPSCGLVLPHPCLEQRAFVLLPLAEIAPRWRHPRAGTGLEALIAALPPGQIARPVSEMRGFDAAPPVESG